MKVSNQVITEAPVKPRVRPTVSPEPEAEPITTPLPEPFQPFEPAPIAPPRPGVLEPDKLCPSQKERITRKIKRALPGEGE